MQLQPGDLSVFHLTDIEVVKGSELVSDELEIERRERIQLKGGGDKVKKSHSRGWE